MSSLISDLRSESISFDRELFLDTNVLLFVYGPFVNGTDIRTRSYSDFLKVCLEKNVSLHINNCVISEFSNIYIKENYNIDKISGEGLEFKEYRKTEKYKEIISSLSDDWYHILSDCNICCTEIDKDMIGNLIDEMPARLMDFNDEIIVHDCIKNGYVLVTHDSDFSNHPEIEIITGNAKLVAACT